MHILLYVKWDIRSYIIMMIIVRHRRLGLDVPLFPLTAAAAACFREIFRESAAASPPKDPERRRKSPRPSRFAGRLDRPSTVGDLV